MNPTPDLPPTDDDPRLLRVVQEYLGELEAGRRPDRRALAARFPDLAEAMAPYLDALDMVHGAAPLLHASSRDGAGSPTAGELQTAEPLGDFRIVREIGRGGMGVVYEAVQRSLGRRVALKVLPFAAALDAKQLQRFKNEAQAAAQLHHTNIVPVYAVGAERGVHFYAMQLIEGQNLAALIEDLRREAPGGTGGEPTGPYLPPRPPSEGETARETRPSLAAQLTTQRSERSAEFFRTVARLAAQAAEALEYAHGLGIVHRDIKPANLLVDDRGNLWITDFGLAQFHADAGLTQTGDLLGTLRYMSPEQAGGQRALIDHRTDVYALGATLYELLTLRPIFDGTDRQTLLRQILHEEPRPPRSLDRSIPPELETIVLKALGKTPAERYATARELADDLKRFLEDRPVRARRPSLVEKATKWARRHRAVVASGVVALLLTAAGLAVATALTARAYDRERLKAREADEQRARADQQRDRADEQRARAEASFLQARAAVDRFVEISEEELAGKPFVEGPRRRLLEAALEYYQDFLKEHRDDPAIQKQLETSRNNVRQILAELTTLMGAGQFALLQHEEVKDALRLSEEQKETLNKILAEWRGALEECGRFSRAERERQLVALAQKQQAELEQVLEPEQFRRLKQIALQQRGPFAFSDPDVATELRLTAEQKKQVRAIQDEMMESGGPKPGGPPRGGPWGPPERLADKPMFGLHKGGEGGPRDRWPDDWRRAREKTLERLLDVLTPEQKRKWQELTGEPVEAPFRFGHPRMPPP
jgi:eukaryotic-like serine/threonine-protein kinase